MPDTPANDAPFRTLLDVTFGDGVVVLTDRRLLRLDLTLPATATTWRLALRDAALAQPWLAGSG